MAARAYDVVIFGATGFTGRLASEHLARRIASNADLRSERFALAGRSEEKLLALRSRLAEISPACKDLAIIVGDGSDGKFLESFLKQTRVVLTYVGPYLKYSLPLARACVKCGTDYCDITGEAPYQQKIVDELHEEAKKGGTTLITSCGYDSIPFDVSTYGLVKHLRERAAAEFGSEEVARRAKISVQALDGSAMGGVSGGTIASAESFVGLAKPLGPQCLDPGFQEGKSPALRFPYAVGDQHERDGSFLGPSIMEAVNQKVVYRTRGLLDDLYGKDFCWQQFTSVKSRLGYIAARALLGAANVALGNKTVKSLLLRVGVLPKPGEGPGEKVRASGYFNEWVYGKLSAPEGKDEKDFPPIEAVVHVEGTRGDPGYQLTSAMSLHTALLLSRKADLASEMNMLGGVLTPASCMGDLLWKELPAVNVTFELKPNINQRLS